MQILIGSVTDIDTANSEVNSVVDIASVGNTSKVYVTGFVGTGEKFLSGVANIHQCTASSHQ